MRGKAYYLLTVMSFDLVELSFDEKYESEKAAKEALDAYSKKYTVTTAYIRRCEDVFVYRRDKK